MSRLTLFWPIPVEAAKDPSVTKSELCVLAFLNSYWATTGFAYPTLRTISARCGMSERSARRCTQGLQLKGWLKRKSGGFNNPNKYLPGPKFTQSAMVPRTSPPDKNGHLVDQLPHEDPRGVPPRTDEYWDEDDNMKHRPSN